MTAEVARHRVPSGAQRAGCSTHAADLIRRHHSNPPNGTGRQTRTPPAPPNSSVTRTGAWAAVTMVIGAGSAVIGGVGIPTPQSAAPSPSDTQPVRLLAATPRSSADTPTTYIPAVVPVRAVEPDALHQADARQLAALTHATQVHGTPGPADEAAPAPQTRAAPISLGAGLAALRVAMTKIGTPYRYGAAGPGAFDCSGLVQWAFKQVGIRLPRVSSAQSRVGTPVSRSQLQPGDLVFFYTPVSHVGIYLGDGKVLNAVESGRPVQISSLARMPFHNAVRV